MDTETTVIWFRRDLRCHDNAALAAATDAGAAVPVYCFDPREYGERDYGGTDPFSYEKTGRHRVRFRLEAVRDLRKRLREEGSDLLVRRGRPESVLPDLTAAVDADTVAFHTLPTPEEETVERATVDALEATDGRDSGSVSCRRFWGHTLHHVEDLPTPVDDISDTYTTFRKAIEGEAPVRSTLAEPDLPPVPADLDPGPVPSPADLGVDPAGPDERGVHGFPGGESAGLDRLHEYVWERDRLREYKQTRNGLVGPDYSSKLSPWLNEGCLSPRRVYEAVQRYEQRRVANDSTYWLVFELRWRDFFQFQFAKHGGVFFTPGGIRRRTDIDWQTDEAALDRWHRGETGVPFVDANMRELVATGYMSNRGRQNAASFLANTLGVDWRRGAAVFETHLVDYDPASNYGNWAYVAGVGNDSRDRSFDVLDQAHRYDSDAAYVTRWLPVLDGLPPEYAHEPWRMSADEQARYGVHLGDDYPRPMVPVDEPGTFEW
jgi:deoxyribodipyrimidine photo-lyase